MKFKHQFRLRHASDHTRLYECGGMIMRIDFIRDMLRVSLIRNKDILPTFSIDPGHTGIKNEGRDKLSLDGFELCSPAVTEDDDHVCFIHCGLDFSIELMNFRITASNDKGILYQDRSGLAYNFGGELGEGSVHYTRREEDQFIYGLGDKAGGVNKNHQHYKLDTNDAMGFRAEYSDPLYKYLPFYICENKAGCYGVYYDTYSEGEADFGREHDNYYELFNSVRYEEENMVFYIIFGDVSGIVRRLIHMTGGICRVPDWAFQYCGSTMEYTDAPDADSRLRSFIYQCEANGIRAGGFYLSSGYTQIGDKRCVFHWNKDKIPDPRGLSDHFRSKGMRIIPNVKPAFLDDHPMYDLIALQGRNTCRIPVLGRQCQLSGFHRPGSL
ncbi:MAG: glycoside hydrolase family 31 protein [Oscillospiraceae bacterium]|nr:glycoside hydrolase family 31 protein [Oscillospiraceae bacterium]